MTGDGRKGPRILKDQRFDDRGRFQRYADARNWAIYDPLTGKIDWVGLTFPYIAALFVAVFLVAKVVWGW